MVADPRSAIERFLSYCRHDPLTGCVNWIGGKTSAQGKTALYGRFWYEGKSWTAHRWAAKHIHGFDIEELDVDHECLNTLCQHHLAAVPPAVNRELQWIRVQVGLQEPPDRRESDDVLSVPADFAGLYAPPLWFVTLQQEIAAAKIVDDLHVGREERADIVDRDLERRGGHCLAGIEELVVGNEPLRDEGRKDGRPGGGQREPIAVGEYLRRLAR